MPREQTRSPAERGADTEDTVQCETPGLLSRLAHAGKIYTIKGFVAPMMWMREWKEYFQPPEGGPNIVKTYESRPTLPIRIFFPASYDVTSHNPLPTLFTIHGGGFCLGHVSDDDAWNRAFADENDLLVVALNYSKAPGYPFPTAVHDVEALLLAVLADESIPIDRRPRTASSGLSRTALLGFSAGGNLSLSVSQLPSVRSHPLAPAAALSVYGVLDLSVPPNEKLANRPWKPSLPSPRGDSTDGLVGLAPTFDWTYIPYAHDLRDPLLSPLFAQRADLPPFVGIVAAELDMLAFESWQLACRLAREGAQSHGGGGNAARQMPDRKSKDAKLRVCGRETEPSARTGELEGIAPAEPDERFAFEENWDGGGVKWMLVPDVLHGFDSEGFRALMGGKEAIADAVVKTKAYTPEVGRWLKDRVWRL
ncbi:alpha/beta hydrolase fold protein [Lasiosphaeria miniovina]|uniref:Alpha/beta hydrolase fold protein n=1 Tax=Lasiosphaeria miniovina TaxID=1954250 RepID=A0AA40DTZ1_9PEZI|nr:alpha/beta hydrolase fold protein [Lasiosphaeria miniovina]KAK0713257.1 alpha/beta hydrolase fold protein [Lasiosphaeria miniovina]